MNSRYMKQIKSKKIDCTQIWKKVELVSIRDSIPTSNSGRFRSEGSNRLVKSKKNQQSMKGWLIRYLQSSPKVCLHKVSQKIPLFGKIWLKVSLFQKNFLLSSILPKNKQKKFDLTTMIPQVDLLSFLFWKNLKTPKRHFEIS